jgi:hypothetical protein
LRIEVWWNFQAFSAQLVSSIVLISSTVATIVGIDEEKGTPELFTCDPAGLVLGHKVFEEFFAVHELVFIMIQAIHLFCGRLYLSSIVEGCEIGNEITWIN